MEPHRVVEARHLHAIEVGTTVREQRCVEQGHIARVGHHARMEHRIVGETSVSAHPHELRGRPLAGSRHRVAVDIPGVDRPGKIEPLPKTITMRFHPGLEIGE